MTLQGEVFSWGRNVEGQLGDNTTDGTITPSASIKPIGDYGASDGFSFLNIAGDRVIDGVTVTIPSSAARWVLTGEAGGGNANYVVEDEKLKWDGTDNTSVQVTGTMASNWRVQPYRWGTMDVEITVDWEILQWDQPSSSTNQMRLLLWVSNVGNVIIGRRISSAAVDETYIQGSLTGTVTWATAPTSGKFKFEYIGGVLKVYMWTGSQWEWDGNTAGYTVSEDLNYPVFIFQHIQQTGSGINVEWSNLKVTGKVPRGNPAVNPGYDTPGFAYWEQPQSAQGGIGNPFLEFTGDTPGTTANNIQRTYRPWDSQEGIIHPLLEGATLPLFTVADGTPPSILGGLYWDGIANNPNGARDLYPMLMFEEDFEIIWETNIISAPNTCCWSTRLSCYQYDDTTSAIMSFEPEYGYSGARRYRVYKNPGSSPGWQNSTSRTDAFIRIKIIHRGNDWEAWGWWNGIWNQLGTTMTQTTEHAPTSFTWRFSNWSVWPGFQADIESLTIVPSGTPDGSFYWVDTPLTVSPSGFTDEAAILVGDDEFVDMVGGRNHGLGIKADGSAHAWGDNQFGQLGDGTLVNKSSPVSVLGNHSFVEIAPASDHNLALKEDGSVFGWGRNDFRQLGSASPLEEAATVDIDNFELPDGEDDSDNFEYNTLEEFQEEWGVSPESDLIEVGPTGFVSWALTPTTPTSYWVGLKVVNGRDWMVEVSLTDLVGNLGGDNWFAGLRYENNDGEFFQVGRTRFDHRFEAPATLTGGSIFGNNDSKVALLYHDGRIYAFRVDASLEACEGGAGCSWNNLLPGGVADTSSFPGLGSVKLFVENRGGSFPEVRGKFRRFRKYTFGLKSWWTNVAGSGDFSGDGVFMKGWSQQIIFGGYSRLILADYNPTWQYQTIPAGQDFDVYTLVDIDFLEDSLEQGGILVEIDSSNWSKLRVEAGGPDFLMRTDNVGGTLYNSASVTSINPGIGFGYNRFALRIARTGSTINAWYWGPPVPGTGGDPTGWDNVTGEWQLLNPATMISSSGEIKIGIYGSRAFASGDHPPIFLFHYWRDTVLQPDPFEDSKPEYPTSPFDIGPKYITTTTGLDHSLAIDRDGDVWAWGRNDFGQCGTGTFSTSANASPALVIGLPDERFVRVTGGAKHSCAMTELGDVWCWGNNEFGQASISPLDIGAISAGGQGYGGAIDYTTGNLWMWGQGVNGVLGTNSTTNRSSPVTVAGPQGWGLYEGEIGPMIQAAKQIPGGARGMGMFSDNVSWATKTDGSLWMWGDATQGNLGTGQFETNYSSPRSVLGGINFFFVASTPGSPASTYALDINGDIWVWGATSYILGGGLGGAASSYNSPVKVDEFIFADDPLNPFIGRKFHVLSAGTFGGMALTGTTAWGWGSNASGYQGRLCTGDLVNYNSPIEIPGTWIHLAHGNNNSMLVDTFGNVWGCGARGGGLSGWGPGGTYESDPTAILGGPHSAIKVAAGNAAQVFGFLRADGSLWMWGSGAFGQLGVGDTSNRTSPTSVLGSGDLYNFVDFVVGGQSGTVAIDDTGQVWGWGHWSSVGDNTTTQRTSPTKTSLAVITPETFKTPSLVTSGATDLDAGGYHNIILDTSDKAWSWGRNDLGQLGDNSLTDRYSPVSAYTTNKFVDISAGEQHSWAMKADGTICTWGAGDWGKLLWNTDENPRSTPTCGVIEGIACVPFLPNTGNFAHSTFMQCGSQFIAWTWGCNTDGKLGDGTITNRSTPVQVIGNKRWLDMSGGGDFTIAIDQDGRLYAWGDDSLGQLGDG